MDLHGRVALITGGGTGIGAAIAADLCAAGARVMIASRREHRLRETARAAGGQGRTIRYRPTDVTLAGECIRLVDDTVAALGPVDVLVNNAGVLCHGGRIEEYGAEEWDRVMATNLRAAFLLCASVLPSMRQRRRGFILMVSSDSGINHFANQSVYGLSKHGMVDLVQFILAEYQEYGVHAAALCPGLTDTEMGLSFHPPAGEHVLPAKAVAAWARWIISQPESVNVARPLVLSNMRNPFESARQR
jgi:NAD(P)-dependent dehydrogenase (short-subunit alcohol dehydrogenase family)